MALVITGHDCAACCFEVSENRSRFLNSKGLPESARTALPSFDKKQGTGPIGSAQRPWIPRTIVVASRFTLDQESHPPVIVRAWIGALEQAAIEAT
jgi:hypothetical protein